MRVVSLWVVLAFVTFGFAAETQRVDINNASKELIETLPGIGPKLAQEIINGRPYRTIEDLDKVKGIGPKKLEQLRLRVLIAPGRPGTAAIVARSSTNQVLRININTASQVELEKLPGIGPKRAEAIIAARPFQKPEDLMKVQGLGRAQYDKLKDQIIVR